jgi:hypothetical protein
VVLLFLALGGGAIAFFLNNRPITPVLVPNAVDTVKENKSTIIERNNTTIKEVNPATPQATPTIQINVPAATSQPVAPAPRVTVTAQPTATATPKAITPSPTATPTPNTGSPSSN